MGVVIEGVEFDDATALKMLKAGVLGVGRKNDPASAVPTRNVLHGPVQGLTGENVYGTFSTPGVRPQRLSALARPLSMMRVVGIRRSDSAESLVGILTGQTADVGTNPTDFCGNPINPGNLKECVQLYRFGSYYVKTELNAVPEIGLVRNRADVPGEILNAGATDNPLIPDIMYRLDDTRSALRYELFKVGVSAERNTAQVLINGVAGVKNSTYPGWIVQPMGLDAQIKTGYTDALAAGNPACAAADSIVVTYGANISGDSINGYSLVEEVTMILQALRLRAEQVGMNGVEWAIVLRPELWAALAEVWACDYLIYGCAGTATSILNRDAMATQQLRTDMMARRFLPIDGVEVTVILDEGISRETVGNNFYNSDIYFVPLRWQGMPLLTWEYFPMDNSYLQEFAGAFEGMSKITSINNGMYLVGHRSTGFCVEYLFAMRGRLILEAPFLAARLDNVQAVNVRHFRDPLPGMSKYVDGGVSLRL